MSNLVPIFETFDAHALTVLREDTGDNWFLAKDLAAPLGVTRDAVRMQVAELDESDKRVSPIYTSTGTKQATFVSESGAIQIIVQSRKPEARRLRKWVCDLAVRYAKGQVPTGGNVTRAEFDQLSRKLDAALGTRKMLKPVRQNHDERVELTRKFIEERMVPAPGYRLRNEEIYPALVGYLREHGADLRASEPFARSVEVGHLLSKSGLKRVRASHYNYTSGLKLVAL